MYDRNPHLWTVSPEDEAVGLGIEAGGSTDLQTRVVQNIALVLQHPLSVLTASVCCLLFSPSWSLDGDL